MRQVELNPGGRQTWGMRAAGYRRRLWRYRSWWPLWVAGAGAIVVALIAATLPSSDQGFAGPLVVVCLITGLAGLVTGVVVGIVQPSAPIELRIRMGLVVLALVTSAAVRGDPLAAGLSALIGSGIALGALWCGRRVMSAMLPQSDDD
jgi:hypothetical protein